MEPLLVPGLLGCVLVIVAVFKMRPTRHGDHVRGPTRWWLALIGGGLVVVTILLLNSWGKAMPRAPALENGAGETLRDRH